MMESKQLRTFKTGLFSHLLALVLMIIPVLAVYPGAGMAETKIKLLMLPFQINAPDDFSYLGTQISSVLAQQLEKDGATLLAVEALQMDQLVELSKSNIDGLRDMAQSLGADQIVWGSFTLIGENFSMDAQLLQVNTTAAADQVFVQGRNIENLLSATQQLGTRVSAKLFPRDLVAAIRVQGNQLVEEDAILRQVETRVGDPYQPAQLSQDLQAIYQMGYFDDIRVEALSGAEGKQIIFHITEKPNIRRIDIFGNTKFDEEEIRDNLTIATGAILNLFQVNNNIDQIKAMYQEKNYYNVKVNYSVKPVGNNQADLTLDIEEGEKIYVTRIAFEGNKSFESDDLQDVIKTAEKGFFFFLTESGDLNREVLDQDVALLTNFYHNHGYIQARIGEPQINFKEKEIHITLKIEEGPQFRVRNVDISGDFIKPKADLLQLLSITKETYFNREVVRQDVLALTDVYASQGYAYAQIGPRTTQVPDEQAVDIIFAINKQQQVYLENITISGNTRTRDKVIRRELKMVEQDLFDNQALKRSVRNLYRLEYFEDVKIDTVKGSADNKMNLNIDVAEKGTGNFNFGVGYSDEESLFINGSVAENNFLGKGQTVKLSGQWGGRTTEYSISFVEPWLFDIPLYFMVMANDTEKSYTGYDRHSNGIGFRIGYRFWDYTNGYWGYKYDNSDIIISNFNEVTYNIRQLEGTNITSSTDLNLVYDSRDRRFNTSEGSRHTAELEYAGLGGDIGYNKLIGSSQKFFPLFKKVVVGFLHGKVGYVYGNDPEKILPDYEKFYLGGVSSLRGFGWQDIHILEEVPGFDEDGNPTTELVKAGGNTMIQINAEIILSLLPKQGVNGFVFYDTGNVYGGEIDLTNMRQSAGFGIRWLSAFAPIQLVYGFILDPREGEQPGRFEFSLGGSF